jgi:hypothetical protein
LSFSGEGKKRGLKGSFKKKWRRKQREIEERILQVLRKFNKFKKD